MADSKPSGNQNLASRVSLLEQKLRQATEALAASQEALRREQSRKADLETRAGAPKAPAVPGSNWQSLEALQAALAAAQQSLELERQKREALERKLESLLAATSSSKDSAEAAAASRCEENSQSNIDQPPVEQTAENEPEPTSDVPLTRKFSDGLRRMWSR